MPCHISTNSRISDYGTKSKATARKEDESDILCVLRRENGSDSNISQPYIDRCKRDRFTTSDDKTFLMFDLDVPGMLEHLRKIKDTVLLLSNPCIEYWFLLHFKDTHKELSSAECFAMLKSVDADYAKGGFSPVMKNVLIDAIEDASKRAKSKNAYSNPSSTVHLLTDEIITFRK